VVVRAARKDSIALDGLAPEGVARRGPVLERAGLEIEIERLAIGTDRENAGIGWLRIRLLGRGEESEGK
jgi:hypothetical protein